MIISKTIAIAIAIGGLMAGSALSAAGYWVYDGMIDDPAIVREVEVRERASCSVRTRLAADLAREEEVKRQQAAAQQALDDFNRIASAAENNRRLQVERLEQEIEDYETTAGADVCRVTIDDLERLSRR